MMRAAVLRGRARPYKRCMTCEGIKPAFRKVMEGDPGSRAALAKIEKRRKEMGIAQSHVTEAEAEMLTADQVEEFFMGARAGQEAEADMLDIAPTINVEAEAANRVRWLLTTPAYTARRRSWCPR